MVITARALLAVVLLVGVYVLVLGLVVLDAVLVFEVLLSETRDAEDSSSPVGALITVPAVGALVWGLAAVSRPTFTDTASVQLTPDQAPLLWRTTRQLADAVGTSPPVEIHLVTEVNAAVTEEAWLLGLVGGRRRLYLGLPLVLGLTHDELRAVIAHELGHYAGRHTRLLAITRRSRESLREIVQRLDIAARVAQYTAAFVWLLRKFFVGYTKCFDLLTLATHRRQEFEADAVAARVVVPSAPYASVADPGTTAGDGRGVVADALRALGALTCSWDRLITGYVKPGREHGIVPERPFDLFAAMLDDVAFRATVDQLKMDPPEPTRTPWDTHPSLARRIAALGGASGGSFGAGQPAVTLLGDWHVAARDLRDKAEIGLPPDAAQQLPNDEWRRRVTELLAVDTADRLRAAAAQQSSLANPGVGAVLDLLRAGRGAGLAATLAAEVATNATLVPAAPSPHHDELTTHLAALVNEALVDAGQVHWVPSWTQPHLAQAYGSMPPYLHLVWAAPRDPDAANRLRELLASVGVDVDAGPPPRRHGGEASLGTSEVEEVGIVVVPRWQRVFFPQRTRAELKAQAIFGALTLGALVVGAVVVGFYVALYDPNQGRDEPIGPVPTFVRPGEGAGGPRGFRTPGSYSGDPGLIFPSQVIRTPSFPPLLQTLGPRN
ncbi:M48 family metalloprotease [Embleya sp. NPDC008237]|uniref:M48 family metalloprotease n=1 Tax=Embleya sp. NPDC008237 TaxID=3363978 RepID=UPI0036EDBC19